MLNIGKILHSKYVMEDGEWGTERNKWLSRLLLVSALTSPALKVHLQSASGPTEEQQQFPLKLKANGKTDTEIPGSVEIDGNKSFERPLYETIVHEKLRLKRRIFDLTYCDANSVFIAVRCCGQAHCLYSLSAEKMLSFY